MSAVQFVNSEAEVLRRAQALSMNINAGKGLLEVMKSNLGPRGTFKMLVGGAGQIKITKDGNVLLHEMQISHPTAAMIARSATAQDDTVGDGTSSNVLFIGELLRQAERLVLDGVHPRAITEGYELAKNKALELLDEFKIKQVLDSAILTQVAKSSIGTKVQPEWVEILVPLAVEAVQTILQVGQNIDLHMVEVLHMVSRQPGESQLVKGLVLDHGGRHPDMPKYLENVYVLNCNVSLEYEKTEVHSGFYFSSAEQRERLVRSERKLTDERAQKIIDLKREVCKKGEGFVVINQKGIDPVCLSMFAKEGILALRRAKRRNAERLMLACGGKALNSVEDMNADVLGWAGSVRQEDLGEEKFTFVENCKNPKSVTVLIKGPDDHTVAIMKEALRDGLRSVRNAIEDGFIVPGAGAFELFLYRKLNEYKEMVSGKAKIGIGAFAEAVLIIPKVLAENSGYDIQDTVMMLLEEEKSSKMPTGLNIWKKGVISPISEGVFDNFCVKKIFLNITSTLAQQLLLCDEILRAGKKMGGDKSESAAAPAPAM